MSIKVDVFAKKVKMGSKIYVDTWPRRIIFEETGDGDFCQIWLSEETYADLRNQILADEMSSNGA